MKGTNKIILVLIFAIIACTVLTGSLKEYKEHKDISNTIGEIYNTNFEIGVREYVYVVEKTIGAYFRAIRENRTMDAYIMHTDEYKAYMSYEEFLKEIEGYDFNSFVFETFALISENVYEARVKLSDGLTHSFIILIKGDSFGIGPNGFLKYENVNEKIKRDKVEYNLVGYKVSLKECEFDVIITNNNKEKIDISSFKIINKDGGNVYSNTSGISVESKSSDTLKIKFATSIDFPEVFEIERKDGNKIRTYIFEL